MASGASGTPDATPEPMNSWLASAGIAGSMAVGAIVIGYYLIYSAGVRWRLRKVW